VAGGVDDVDLVAVVVERGVLGEDGDAATWEMMAMLKMGFRAGCAVELAAEVSGFGMVWGLLTAGYCPVWLSFWGALG